MADLGPFKLPVGPDQEKTFRNIVEIEDFLESERRAFEWLTASTGWNTKHPDNLANRVGNEYSQISGKIDIAKNKRSDEAIKRLRNQFNMSYSQKGLIYSKSEKGKYLDDLRDSQGDEYAAIFYRYSSNLVGGDRSVDLKAAFEAFQYEWEGANYLDSEREALAELRAEWDERYQSDLEKKKSKVDSVVDSARNDLHSVKETGDNILQQLRNRKSDFQDLIEESEMELEEITEAYREQISLQEPVRYWRNKGWWHLAFAIGWGIATLVAGFTVGWLFISQAGEVLGPQRQPNYAQVIVLLTIATLGIWGLRLLVRLFFSQVHLQNDARERSVMLESFLAMLNEGHIDPEEKDTILNTLFRPAQSDIVKDDSAPPNIAEYLSRFGSR